MNNLRSVFLGNHHTLETFDHLPLRRAIPGEPGRDYPIYSIDILCEINPRNCFGRRITTKNANRDRGNDQVRRARNRNEAARRERFRQQITRGEIPGVPGKDYPINSLHSLRQRGHNNIQAAPANLITSDYPGIGCKLSQSYIHVYSSL